MAQNLDEAAPPPPPTAPTAPLRGAVPVGRSLEVGNSCSHDSLQIAVAESWMAGSAQACSQFARCLQCWCKGMYACPWCLCADIRVSGCVHGGPGGQAEAVGLREGVLQKKVRLALNMRDSKRASTNTTSPVPRIAWL